MKVFTRYLILTCIAIGCLSQDKFTWKPDNCPVSCKCSTTERTLDQTSVRWVKTIECRAEGLKRLPERMPHDVQALIADDNQLQNFNELVERLSMLKDLKEVVIPDNYVSNLVSNVSAASITKLDVSNNAISELTVKLFSSFPNMINLSLQRNSIRDLNQNLCSQNITHLKSLVLSYNLIEDLEWMKKCTFISQIQLLDISGNKQRSRLINDSTFSGVSFLTTLLMEDMELDDLQNEAFSGLKVLETLDLDNNFLTSIPTKALSKLVHLKTLSLNGNQVKQITPGSFRNYPKLELIELTNLPSLQIIDEYSFKNLPELKNLLIFDNSKLSYIDGKAFSGCHQMVTLDAHHTLIETILQETIDSLPNLENINLKKNPINCNCMMSWASKWFQGVGDHQDDKFNSERILCANPAQFRGSLLSQVTFSDDNFCTPEIQPTFPIQASVAQHNEVVLACRAFGEPKPEIFWILPDGTSLATNDSALNENASLDDYGTLIVKNPVAGVYKCFAKNDHGLATRTTNVRILEPPKQDQSAAITSTTHMMKTLSVTTKPTYPSTKFDHTSATQRNTTSESEIMTTETTPKLTSHHVTSIPSRETSQHTSSTFYAPSIRVINVDSNSALITWSGRNLMKSLQENYDEVMTLTLKHEGRVIYNKNVKPFWVPLLSKMKARPSEFNISSLYPGSTYEVCLSAQCCIPTNKVKDCTAITTLPYTKKSVNVTSMALGIFLALVVFFLLAIMIGCCWKNCKNAAKTHSLIDYEVLDEDETPIHDIYQPLIQDPTKKTKSEKIIETTITTSYI